MRTLLFYLGLSTLFTHELDAVMHHEWRLLPLLNLVQDDVARSIFILLHVPFFALLMLISNSSDRPLREWSRTGISLFLVIHAVLHLLFSGHPGYEFDTLLSQLLIYGGALFGLLFTFLKWLEGRPAHG